jgi:predicted RNase H-like HicB family nuclease
MGYKFVVEQHPDGFIAYPLGVKGVAIGQGETRESALLDARSALEFHIETFGRDVLEAQTDVLAAYIEESVVSVAR